MLQLRMIRPIGWLLAALVVAMLAHVSAGSAQPAQPRARSFESPEAAVTALVDALRRHDRKEVSAIFGPAGRRLVDSGDPVGDREAAELFVTTYDRKHELVRSGTDRATLTLGEDAWPFPVPIVLRNQRWVFDAAAGAEDVLTRRIGRNELSAIQTVQAYGDAQRDYVALDRNGDGVREYAQRFLSTAGKRDGLYWATAPGEEESPIGPLIAQASREGYRDQKRGASSGVFHGYIYRILTAQGPNAPGGAYSYMANGRMIGGFAVVAYPAAYGSSGVMTFVMNHDGVVFEKDLGPDTAAAAGRITRFDPDASWKRVDPAG